MAVKTVSGNSASWSTATWSPAGAPANGDSVVVNLNNGATLTVDVVTAAVTGITFSSSSGRSISVSNGAKLNVTSAGGDVIALQRNTLTLAGATSTVVATTISMTSLGSNRGLITGQGTIQAAVTGSGNITANGGVLFVKGALTVYTATINAGATLELGGATTWTNGPSLTAATQTLEITTGGSLAQALTLTGGAKLVMNGGSTSGSVTNTSGVVSGFGTISGALLGAGTVTATGGTLNITGAVDASGAATTFDITDGTLKFGNVAVGTATIHPIIDFSGATANGVLDLTSLTGSNLTNFGSRVQLENIGGTDGIKVTNADHVVYSESGATASLAVYNASNSLLVTLQFIGTLPGDYFNVSGGEISYCFMAGTLIATPDGLRAVETLAIGDMVLTAEGGTRPVLWIGRQTIAPRFADPMEALPVRISAGALGENLPERDLLVSPGHAVLVEGVLIAASALVNGTTVRRERDVPEVLTWYHIELEDHALVLAEGVPAETFVDNVDRMAFDNYAEYQAMYPEGRETGELPMPRAISARQVPASVRARLADRAAAVAGEIAAAA